MFMSVDGDDDDVRCWLSVVMNTTTKEMPILRVLSMEKTTHWFLSSFGAVACQAGVPQPRTTKTKKKWRKSLFSTLSCWNAHKNRWKTNTHTPQRAERKKWKKSQTSVSTRERSFYAFLRGAQKTRSVISTTMVLFLLCFSFLFCLTPIREEREKKVTQWDRANFCIFHIARDYIKDPEQHTARFSSGIFKTARNSNKSASNFKADSSSSLWSWSTAGVNCEVFVYVLFFSSHFLLQIPCLGVMHCLVSANKFHSEWIVCATK